MLDFLGNKFLKGVDPFSATGRRKYGMMGAIIGVLTNFMLFLIKLFLGLITKSVSVMADSFNNLSDTLSSFITIVGFKLGAMPADENHPFGHGRIEYFSGLIVSLLVFSVGILFFVSSIKKIFNPEPLDISTLSVILLILSIFVKVIMSNFNFKLGEKINSTALKAAALDARGDVLISSTVVVGLIASKFIKSIPIDGIVGVIVAIMIIKSAIGLIMDTVNPLLGDKVDPELITEIEEKLKKYDEIYGVHDTVVHNYGPSTAMSSTHAEVRDDISLVEIHDIIDKAEKEIGKELGIHLVIHIDPIKVSDKETKEILEKVSKIITSDKDVVSVHDMRLRPSSNSQKKILFAEVDIDNSILHHDEESEISRRITKQINDIYSDIEIRLSIDKDSTMLR